MIFTFTQKKEDILKAILFYNSRSPRTEKQWRKSWSYRWFVIFLLFFLLWLDQGKSPATYFLIAAVICVFGYPFYINNRRLKSTSDWIEETHKNWDESEYKISFSEEYMEMSGKHSCSKISLTQIEDISETAAYYFMKVIPGQSLVVPKNTLNDEIAFKEALRTICQNLEIEIFSDLNWK